jgi:prepilin-type N-terminal cleavage/methylation domain-containing protein
MMKPHRRSGGFSLIELLIVIAIILIIISMAVPMFNKARMHAAETAAEAAIRTLHTVQMQYFSQYGKYATSLSELGAAANGSASAAAAGLIEPALTRGVKGGYKFTLTASAAGYAIHAEPLVFGSNGGRTFYSDQTMVLHENNSAEPATATSPESHPD